MSTADSIIGMVPPIVATGALIYATKSVLDTEQQKRKPRRSTTRRPRGRATTKRKPVKSSRRKSDQKFWWGSL